MQNNRPRQLDIRLLKNVAHLLILITAFFGCSGTLVPTRTLIQDYTIDIPDPRVFDVILAAAQTRNLNVAVVERQAGIIRFESTSLTPAQLDTYCEYPYVRSDGRAPWDTFTNWDKRSQAGTGGPVRGRVSISLLVKTAVNTTTINMRGNWISYNKGESTPCTSTGTFEREFIADIKNMVGKLSQSSLAQSPQANQASNDTESKKPSTVDTEITPKSGKSSQETKGSPTKPETSSVENPVIPKPSPRKPTGVTVKDSDFDSRAQFEGIKQQTTDGGFLIRSWLDKKTGEATHQLYVADVYTGKWKFWVIASDDQALSLKLISISRDVESCRYGSCIYTEHFGIELPDSLLTKRRNDEYRIKIRARSGHEKILAISSEMISSQLDEIERYRVENKLYRRTQKPTSEKKGTPL